MTSCRQSGALESCGLVMGGLEEASTEVGWELVIRHGVRRGTGACPAPARRPGEPPSHLLPGDALQSRTELRRQQGETLKLQVLIC